MVTQALYRRWRSRTFGEILGQDHITHTLLNALRAGRIAHAYLFSGPRGTGKTTTARVLAKAVNCLDPQDGEPCNQCAICRSLNEGRSLDLIEIDAASNRGIDEIRDLREKIAFSPSECRYKVYVVDEVHMLTDPAFNALLKTLEEPPPHAIFVLATTEAHRIPATVLSRCQRHDFRRVSLSNLKKKLELICEKEKVRIEPEALEAIARYASGSFRDAESLLDQLVSFGAEEIKLEDMRRVLGSAPEQIVAGIAEAGVARDVGTGLRLINEALDSGVEPRQLTREVLDYLRGLLLLKNGGASLLNVTAETLQEMQALAERIPLQRLLVMVRLYNAAATQLRTGGLTQLPLELAFVEASLEEGQPAASNTGPGGPATSQPEASGRSRPVARGRPPEAKAAPAATKRKPGKSAAAEKAASEAPDAAAPAAAAPGEAEEASPTDSPSRPERDASRPRGSRDASQPRLERDASRPSEDGEVTLEWLQANWQGLLAALRPRNRMVEALLRSCEPVSVANGVVTLGFYHRFHKDRVSEELSAAVVEEALAELSGQTLRLKCQLLQGDREQKEKDREAAHRETLLDNPVVHEAVTRYGARVVDVH